MVTFFIGTLIFSSVGLLSLIGLKRYELTTGRIVGAQVRPWVSRFFQGVSLWVERILPTLVRMYGKFITRAFLRSVYRVTAHAVLRVEQGLERALQALRHTTDVRRGMGEASAFLREVSEHKRKLLRAQGAQVRLHKE